MRIMVVSASTLIVGALALACGSVGANAFPKPAIEAAKGAQAVTTVGWRRRYWRRYGVWPDGPEPYFDDDAIVTADDGVVIIVPRRPSSCGLYHYWDGVACVDARYNDPYLGPK